jgi:hypothetical protein
MRLASPTRCFVEIRVKLAVSKLHEKYACVAGRTEHIEQKFDHVLNAEEQISSMEYGDNSIEVCQDCIWWNGDSSGMQGYCVEDHNMALITGRYEECINFLARYLLHWENIMADEFCRICGWEAKSGALHDKQECLKTIHPHAYTCCGEQICVCGNLEREARNGSN